MTARMTCATPPVTVDCSIRHYCGEHAAHVHDGHAQLLYALSGRMELEVDGRSSFVNTACGLLIPGGQPPRLSGPARARKCWCWMWRASPTPRWTRYAGFKCPPLHAAPQLMPAAQRLQLLLQFPGAAAATCSGYGRHRSAGARPLAQRLAHAPPGGLGPSQPPALSCTLARADGADSAAMAAPDTRWMRPSACWRGAAA